MLTGLRTLVLSANYVPVSLFPKPQTIPAEDAVTRILNGTSHMVAEYDRQIKTPNLVMNWPSIIASNEMIDRGEGIALSNETLFYRDHGFCAYCERELTLTEMEREHVIPRSKGGPNTWENVVASCRSCNSLKGNSMPIGEWTPRVRPYKPTYWDLLRARKKFPISIDDPSWIDFIGPWDSEVRINR